MISGRASVRKIDVRAGAAVRHQVVTSIFLTKARFFFFKFFFSPKISYSIENTILRKKIYNERKYFFFNFYFFKIKKKILFDIKHYSKNKDQKNKIVR